MELWVVLAQAFWFIAPAYAANAFPPLARGKAPLDFGRKFCGHRILGNGKTIKGTTAGIFFGIFAGSVQFYIQLYIPEAVNGVSLNLVVMTPMLAALLSAGAMAGDIAGSFIKRRLGKKSGKPLPLLDQLGFLVFALLFAGTMPSIEAVIALLILTPIIHFIANIIGYFAKLKKNPW